MSSSGILQRHLDSGITAEPFVAITSPSVEYSVADFVKLLFLEFEGAGIEYCVLHGWDGLPDALCSDLDLAVHPRHRGKIAVALGKMRDYGFLPIDCHNYEVNAQTFYFCWFRDSERLCIAVDVIFDYRGNGTIVLTGDQLIAGRRRYRSFWIPEPAVALTLLARQKNHEETVCRASPTSDQTTIVRVGNAGIGGSRSGSVWQ